MGPGIACSKTFHNGATPTQGNVPAFPGILADHDMFHVVSMMEISLINLPPEDPGRDRFRQNDIQNWDN